MSTGNKKQQLLKWLKKLGVWGFLFFLIKGLIWLAIGYWVIGK
ncbi:alanyl-tRNA synthetase [Chitinophaga sp. MM2321]